MALNIHNVEVERLAREVAKLACETKTEAIRGALLERRARAGKASCRKSLREYLEQEVWPMMPAGELGRGIGRDEEDRILGYGLGGY